MSKEGGSQPRWRRDGREVYWIAPDAKLLAASLEISGGSLTPGTPVALFQTRIWMGGTDEPQRGQYDVGPDGRFLINTIVEDVAEPPITLIQNWRPRR